MQEVLMKRGHQVETLDGKRSGTVVAIFTAPAASGASWSMSLARCVSFHWISCALQPQRALAGTP